jgi:hypothetical protein
VSIQLHVAVDLARAACDHLVRSADRIGFFLADVNGGVFTLREWRPIADDALECMPNAHAVLTDDAAGEVIRWAHEGDASLVEVHSHGRFTPAAFSHIDVASLAEWVSGVRWRLRGAPYAAVVTAAGTVDAWAWIGATTEPAQVDAVVIGGTDIICTTGATLERIHAQREL